MNEINNNREAMTYIHLSKHSVKRCVERNPQFSDITYQKYAEKEAKIFLENKLREWLSASWRKNSNLRRKSDWKWYITLTDWEHKLVYTKVEIGELLIVTYWFKDDITRLEWSVLKMLPSSYKKSRYKKY